MLNTEFRTVKHMIEEGCDFPLDVIPNRMGINLCSVLGITFTKMEDGQYVSLTIHFNPDFSGNGKTDEA